MKLGPSYSVAYSPDGLRLAVVRARGVDVLMTSGAPLRRNIRLKHPSDVAFSPDGTLLAAKTTSGDLFIWSTDGTSEPRLVRSAGVEGTAPSFSPCGRFVVDGSWDGLVDLVGVDDGTTAWSETFPGEMICGVAATRERHLWAFLHSPKATRPNAPPAPAYVTLRSYPFQGSSVRVVTPDLAHVRSMSLSPDGGTIAIVHGAPPNSLSLVDALSGTVRQSVAIHSGGTTHGLAWSADGTNLASVQSDHVRIYSSELALLTEVASRYAAGVAFSPDGDAVALASWGAGFTFSRAESLRGHATGPR